MADANSGSNTSDIEYTLLVLSDGNLPTGSFVASSGLESYLAHGFTDAQGLVPFFRSSLATYAASALLFVHEAHVVVSDYIFRVHDVDDTISELVSIDALYHATVLNTPARRASMAQGVALLTLYSKGFASADTPRETALVERLKILVRRGMMHGHLPVCWAVLTAALALTSERSEHLHLFLHARGLLSAAIRLNALGPYAAQQLLLHNVRPLITAEMELHRTRLADAANQATCEARIIAANPVCTWPLGEILAARHDLQHTRIFNS